MGVGKLNLTSRPSDMPTKQAAAAVGQCELMYIYDKLFSEHNHTVAQILITGEDTRIPERKHNFENTIKRLLELNVIPVVNENDSVATEELVIGDNDTLGVIVAVSVEADLIILLSDINGLYTADPRQDKKARLLKHVEEITPEIESMTGGAGSRLGTGGMTTKVAAAKLAMEAGIEMVIANGSVPEVLYDIVDGKEVGTRFVAKRSNA